MSAAQIADKYLVGRAAPANYLPPRLKEQNRSNLPESGRTAATSLKKERSNRRDGLMTQASPLAANWLDIRHNCAGNR